MTVLVPLTPASEARLLDVVNNMLGPWNFVLDNCTNDTITGAGVGTVVRAAYA